MTTLFEEEAQCSVCGTRSDFTAIGSSNRFGSPDLDTRPPEMIRSTISAWVQRCPNCGACASNVSEVRSGAQEIIQKKEYRDQLDNPNFPELANSFLCQALLDREAEDFAAAIWAVIHAAWACDDADYPDQAKVCRENAAEMLAHAEERGQQVIEEEGAGPLIRIDLLRRSGRIGQAREVIAAQRNRITEGTIAQILDFQSDLLDRNDMDRHTIEEALKEKHE